jgi:hypothetical protein
MIRTAGCRHLRRPSKSTRRRGFIHLNDGPRSPPQIVHRLCAPSDAAVSLKPPRSDGHIRQLYTKMLWYFISNACEGASLRGTYVSRQCDCTCEFVESWA